MAALSAGVVGCGGAGTNHAKGYRRATGVELVGVCDLDAELATQVDVPAFDSIEAMLRDTAPDIVSVATPESAHHGPTLRALDAGAHVFCEKILAGTVADGVEMVERADELDRELAVNYNYRHMPAFKRIHTAITTDELGEITLVTADAHAYGWHHTLDLMRLFLGTPRSVQATLDHDTDLLPDRFDLPDPLYVPTNAVTVTLEFESGAIATVSATLHDALDDHLIDLAVYGAAGRARITGMTPTDTTGQPADGPLAQDLEAVESITLEESFYRSVEAFVRAIQEDDSPPTTGADGLSLLQLETAVLTAAERGRRVGL